MRSPLQLSLLEDSMGVAELARDRTADYGEVFTRRWVVELILDLVGYTPDRDLASMVVVEPSCGIGAFLVPVVDRLVASATQRGRDLRSLTSAVQAFDLLEVNAERARKTVGQQLSDAGLELDDAAAVAEVWVRTEDFLRHQHRARTADYVVGNPPYIRLENVPPRTMDAYRRMCPTMRGRADIYVGFIERGLELLKTGGSLGFICADRWMRNQYGADLRELIARSYSVDTVITMHDVDAFEDDVSAYPAIVVLQNERQSTATVVETNHAFGQTDAAKLSAWTTRSRRQAIATPTFEASRLQQWFGGRDLWPCGSPAQLALVADLEARFPALENRSTATRVGIGVATGCDDVYITQDADLVEEERLLPLLQASDTTDGSAKWSGGFLINPWNAQGLVDLAAYPRLQHHFDIYADRLRIRHVARKRPLQWYRTIDRVDPNLLARPKLILPDLKASAHPVLDEGRYYPHHNLYFVVSDTWDLEVLGGLLLSDIANLFVGAYCVKMRGGCYRFQAQYLRRIRVPEPASITPPDARALARAFVARDREAATSIALRLYGVNELPRLL